MSKQKKSYAFKRVIVIFISVFVVGFLVTLFVPNDFEYKRIVYYASIIIVALLAPNIMDRMKRRKMHNKQEQ